MKKTNEKKQYLYFFGLHRGYVPTKPAEKEPQWQQMWEGMLDENGKPRKQV